MKRSVASHNIQTEIKLMLSASLGLALSIVLVVMSGASGLELGQHSAELSNDLAGATSSYDIKMTLADSSSALGSIEIQACSNSSLIVDPCQAPAGLSFNGASLSTQSGATGFTISPLSTANNLIISRTAAPPAQASLEYAFDNITNPSSEGSYFIRLLTYSSTDATGTPTNYGGLAFAIVKPVNVEAQVPPYITFCVGAAISGYNCSGASGDYIDFGELTPGQTATGQEQFLVATNAKNGYNISVSGHTMTSGNNIITPLNNGGQSVAGTSQFGLNLVANSSPAIGQDPSGPGVGAVTSNYDQPNIFRFDSGELLATSSAPSDYRKYTVSYIVNRPPGQAPGIYATTMTFIALGNF